MKDGFAYLAQFLVMTIVPQIALAEFDGTGIPVKLAPPDIIELQMVGKQVTSSSGESVTIPFFATAVSLNVTIVNPVASGFVTVWPCGVSRPLSSNLNVSRLVT